MLSPISKIDNQAVSVNSVSVNFAWLLLKRSVINIIVTHCNLFKLRQFSESAASETEDKGTNLKSYFLLAPFLLNIPIIWNFTF